MISAKRFPSVRIVIRRPFQHWQTHNVAFLCEINFLLFHGAKNDLECVQQVVEDSDLPLFPLGCRKALGVKQAHLFQHGRLARLTSTFIAVSTPLASLAVIAVLSYLAATS